MEIEYLREKAKDLNCTIPFELNKLEEKTTYVDKIYKILDKFNVKLDYIQFEQKMNLVRGSTSINNIKEGKINSIRQKEGTTGRRTNRKSQRINRKHKRIIQI